MRPQVRTITSHPFMESKKDVSHSVLRNGMHANPKSLEKTHPLQKWKLRVSPKPQLPSVSSFHPMLTGSAKKNLILGYTTVFFDVLGYSLITPILPFLSKEMNATDFEQGLLFSGYALSQALSPFRYSPSWIGLWFMGTGSDYYGRKLFFMLSLLGSTFGCTVHRRSCVGAIFQGLSPNMVQLNIWRFITGLLAGSPIVTQALIADCTSIEDRNKYLAINESVISAACVLGPALGGILGGISLSLPLFVAGGTAGVALLFAAFFMEETNPDVNEIYKMRKSMRGKTEEEKKEIKAKISEMYAAIHKSRQSIHVTPTKTMIYCFLLEFCNRWALNAFNSRYGSFLLDKFGVTSTVFSYIMCAQSALLCIQQGWLYGVVVRTWGVPIIIVAMGGMIMEGVAYVLMAAPTSLGWSIVGGILLMLGYGFVTPTSSSIISVSVC